MGMSLTVAQMDEGSRFRIGRNCYTLLKLCTGSALVRSVGESRRVRPGEREFTAKSGDERHISLGAVVDEVMNASQ